MRFPLSKLIILFVFVFGSAWAQRQRGVAVWLTNADRSVLIAEQPKLLPLTKDRGTAKPTILINDAKHLQTLDGFGFALTGGSAQLLQRMTPDRRHALLQELFGRGPGAVDVSYLRVSIGSSDMNDRVYTYDDMPKGETDPELKRFSLQADEADVIPVLKEILTVSPGIKILASPWSAPSWMKTNENPKGGSLRPEFYADYAQYFVRYLKGMQAQGIRIDAVTIQNEPLNPKNTPSMVMQPEEQAAFIRDALGPALRANNLKTKIILYDHNCDRPDYPLTVLKDPAARQFVDGSGFHLYGGDISAMTEVHNAYPEKNLYFTEQMVVENQHGKAQTIGEPVQRIVIGAMRNWSRNVLLWNLAADPSFGPHTDNGGCPVCQGAITLDGDRVERNIAYYTVAQISKFVPPGSVRVDSNETTADSLPNVAFHTPEGHTVLLVVNTGAASRTFTVASHDRSFTAVLDAGSTATYVW